MSRSAGGIQWRALLNRVARPWLSNGRAVSTIRSALACFDFFCEVIEWRFPLSTATTYCIWRISEGHERLDPTVVRIMKQIQKDTHQLGVSMLLLRWVKVSKPYFPLYDPSNPSISHCGRAKHGRTPRSAQTTKG